MTQKHVTLKSSAGQPVEFTAADCPTLKLETAPHPGHPEDADGKLSLSCHRGPQTLIGSVRFERCGF